MSLVAVQRSQLPPLCQEEGRRSDVSRHADWLTASSGCFWSLRCWFVFTEWSRSILDWVRSSFAFLVVFVGTEPQICLHLISASLLWPRLNVTPRPSPAERTYVVNYTDYSTCYTLINCISISSTNCSCKRRHLWEATSSSPHRGQTQDLCCCSHVGRDSIILQVICFFHSTPGFSMQWPVYAIWF